MKASFLKNESFVRGIPYIQPLNTFVDDRGWSLMNLLGGDLSGGQLNVSSMHPNIIKAWHRHKVQIDCWIPIRGTLKCAVYNPDLKKLWHWNIGEKNPAILFIPPGCWHGCSTVGNEVATLLYYVTERYNLEDPDEERCRWDTHVEFNWCTEGSFSWSSESK